MRSLPLLFVLLALQQLISSVAEPKKSHVPPPNAPKKEEAFVLRADPNQQTAFNFTVDSATACPGYVFERQFGPKMLTMTSFSFREGRKLLFHAPPGHDHSDTLVVRSRPNCPAP